MLTLAVMRTELVKSLRRTRTYVAYGILVLIPIIMATAINLNPPDGREGRLLVLASQTGLLLPGFALRVTSAFMLVIVVALFGGDAIAGEASWGNLRYLLMRPIGRGRLVFSKFVVAMFCAWLAVVIVVVTALIVGSIVFGTAAPQFPLNVLSGGQSTGEQLRNNRRHYLWIRQCRPVLEHARKGTEPFLASAGYACLTPTPIGQETPVPPRPQ